jgi:hypothetical protein
MICGMPGRLDHLKRPAGAGQRVAVADADIRREAKVVRAAKLIFCSMDAAIFRVGLATRPFGERRGER